MVISEPNAPKKSNNNEQNSDEISFQMSSKSYPISN